MTRTTTTEPRDGSWESFLSPWPLLAGIACSFAACCLAGWVFSHHNPFIAFERFLPHIAPDSLFYPTVSQVRALARETLDRDKIAVIVGGNSIAHGVGQRSEYLWTKRLQEELGDDYCTINLAMRGAGPGDFGAVAAESLSADYPRLIYMAVIGSGSVVNVPDGTPPYRYFFWDAYYQGLLHNDAERESNLRQIGRERKHDAGFEELRLQMRVDGFVHSRDLWTSLAYEHFSTVWCPRVSRSWWLPRKVYGDEERGGLVPFESRYPSARDANEIRIVGNFSRLAPFLFTGPQAAVPVALRAGFPAPYRRRTLLLLCQDSPYYVERLPPAERACYRGAYAAAAPWLEDEGFATLQVGADYSTEDYFDRSHLSEVGGRRLAGEVAVKVRQMARSLGFVREEQP